MFSWLNIRIGWFLAVRQIMRANLWTTVLTVFIMVLTFLNLVVVSGVLVGLIQGAINDIRTQYTSDVVITSLTDKKYIENSPNLIAQVQSLPQVKALTARYREGGMLEANYKTRKDTDKPNTTNASIVGIDPDNENAVSNISKLVVKGSYLTDADYDSVLIGRYLLKQYMPIETPGFPTLENVDVGSKIRLSVNGVTREVTVKGVIMSKTDELSMSVYMLGSQLRSMIGRNDGNVDQIAILLKEGVDPAQVRNMLLLSGAGKNARVQTYIDAEPKFVQDMVTMFNMLGNAFSSIGLVVAAVTIFIVIFINALTRRKYIGILKGIGIDSHAIEIAYVFQSIFYALIGSAVGLLIVYGILVPTFIAHPIDFPFSDGILVAPVGQTMVRVLLLVVSTLIAGYVPARIIVKKNTLDSILGRN